jgi:hypothetical protein
MSNCIVAKESIKITGTNDGVGKLSLKVKPLQLVHKERFNYWQSMV